QTDYKKKYAPKADLGGLCFCLSAKWCHMMFAAEKGNNRGPRNEPSDRLKQLDVKDVALNVVGNHLIYTLRSDRNRQNTATLKGHMQLFKSINKNGILIPVQILEALADIKEEKINLEYMIKNTTAQRFGIS